MAERDNPVRPFLVREREISLSETRHEALNRLTEESQRISEEFLGDLREKLRGVSEDCGHAKNFYVLPGEREELRQVGEFITAALDRIAALRARNGR